MHGLLLHKTTASLVNTDLENAQISIYNTAGQLIETSSAKQGLNTINLSGQAAGVYLVNIKLW